MSDAPLTCEPIDEGLLVHLTEDVTLDNAASILNELMQRVGAGVPKLVVDMQRVTYMDSAGIAALVAVLKVQRRGGHQMVLCGLSQQVHDLLRMLKLDVLFQFAPDQRSAVSL